MRRPVVPTIVVALVISGCGGSSTSLCHRHYLTTVTAQASDVAFARSPHGPIPVNQTPTPVAFDGLADDSPVALCLVRPAEGSVDTVYAISVVDDRVVVVFRQSGSDEISIPI
jgi:hypothetical protein